MSHHYSGPALGFPHGDARLDLTDLYAFGKPGDDRKSILIMNVHPSFSLEPRGPTRSDPFAHEAIYEFRIDTDGDSVADIAYRVRFSPFEGGAQTATLRCVRGAAAAGVGDTGDVLIEAAPVSLGRTPRVTQVGEHRLFAGWRSDPFFFDVLGVLDGFKFTHETSSQIRMCAASSSKSPMSLWRQGGSAFGPGPWTAPAAAGCRPTAARGLRRPPS